MLNEFVSNKRMYFASLSLLSINDYHRVFIIVSILMHKSLKFDSKLVIFMKRL